MGPLDQSSFFSWLDWILLNPNLSNIGYITIGDSWPINQRRDHFQKFQQTGRFNSVCKLAIFKIESHKSLSILQPQNGEKKSELLPTSWNSNKELYTLRYRSNDDKSSLLLKAITVDSSLIFNLMVNADNGMKAVWFLIMCWCQLGPFYFHYFLVFFLWQDSTTDKVTDMTMNISDYINEANLQSFERLVTFNLFMFYSSLNNGFIAWHIMSLFLMQYLYNIICSTQCFIYSPDDICVCPGKSGNMSIFNDN